MNGLDNIISKVKDKLNEFIGVIKYKNLEISGCYYPYKEYENDSELKKQYPNSDVPGVYIFMSEDKNRPLYIGKSEGDLGKRIWSHIGRVRKGDETECYPNAEKWIKAKGKKVCFGVRP